MDEAVLRSGLSRSTILDWSRSGKVKREKRKGKVYLWVSDLATLTPLSRVEPEVEPLSAPEVLPSALPENYSGGSNIVQIKLMGDQLKENLEKQEQVLEHVVALQTTLEKLEHQEVLDERTKKELSLLGNVFRSLHQQNEKVNLALVSQKEAIEKWQQEQGHREELIKKVEQSDKKATTWLFGLLSATVLFGVLLFWIYREWENDQELSSHIVENLEEEKRELNTSLEKEQLDKEVLREKKNQEIKSILSQHNEKVESLESEFREKEKSSQLQYENQLKQQQDKFLTHLEQKDKQVIKQLEQQKSDFEKLKEETEQRKQAEIERLEKTHQSVLNELKKSELEKWQQREAEVKTLLQELKNAKGTDRQQWLKRLDELDQVLLKMQTQVPVEEPEKKDVKPEGAAPSTKDPAVTK